LVGGGHAHIEVLRQFARVPEPGIEIVLVSPEASLLYSGMLPGVVAGRYCHRSPHGHARVSYAISSPDSISPRA
jgi:selenide,water dikinase